MSEWSRSWLVQPAVSETVNVNGHGSCNHGGKQLSEWLWVSVTIWVGGQPAVSECPWSRLVPSWGQPSVSEWLWLWLVQSWGQTAV